MNLLLFIAVVNLLQEDAAPKPVTEVAAILGQSKFETSLQQREAVDFLWTPGELICDALRKEEGDDETIMADFIVTTRLKRTGGTDILFVRYFVDESGIRFFVLHGEPLFISSQFPITPVTFGAAWKSNGETAVYSTQRDLSLTGRTNPAAPQLSFSHLHYDITQVLNSPRLFVGEAIADGVEIGALRVIGDEFEQISFLPQVVYSVPADNHFKVHLRMEVMRELSRPEEQEAMTLAEVPVCYRFGGRTITSRLRRQNRVAGIVMPQMITMSSRSPELTDASWIARAQLLQCDFVAKGVMEASYQPDFKVYQAFCNLSPHWGKFQDEAAQAELKHFESTLNVPGPATLERLAYHGRMCIVHIFADDKPGLAKSLNAYTDDAISLGLAEVLPEMLYHLQVRTDWSGSQEAYALVLNESIRRTKGMPGKARVASALHMRHFGIAPYALFRLAFPEGVTTAVSQEEPSQALRSLYLAASFCPGFALEIGTKSQEWYLAADAEMARKELGKNGLPELCREIRRMTAKTLERADPQVQQVWAEQIDAVYSWTKGE